MARTPVDIQHPDNPMPEPTPAFEQAVAASNELAAADAVIMEAEDAFKMLGRIEAAKFMEAVSGKIIAETAIKLKEGKKYKGLPYQDENGNWRRISTFDEFCQYKLGKTGRRIRDYINNYKNLGPEIYEQAEALGFRQVDYNALKALPEDDKKMVLMAVEANDGDKAIELLQAMAVKHVKEKESLSQQAEEISKDLAAKEELLAKKDEKINELDQKLTRKVIDNADKPAGWEELEALQIETRHIHDSISASLRSVIIRLQEASDDSTIRSHELAAAQAIAQIITRCDELADDLGLQVAMATTANDPARDIAAQMDGWMDEIEAETQAKD